MSAIANLVALLIFDLRARWRPRRTQHQAGTDTGLGVMVLLPRHLPLPLATSMTACGQIGAQVRADGTMQPRMLGTPAGVTSNTSVFISGSPNSTSAAPQTFCCARKTFSPAVVRGSDLLIALAGGRHREGSKLPEPAKAGGAPGRMKPSALAIGQPPREKGRLT